MTFRSKLQNYVGIFGQATVSKICGVTVRTVYNWLNGTEPPRATRVGVVFLMDEHLKNYEASANQTQIAHGYPSQESDDGQQGELPLSSDKRG